jgi:hypothetical protein
VRRDCADPFRKLLVYPDAISRVTLAGVISIRAASADKGVVDVSPLFSVAHRAADRS